MRLAHNKAFISFLDLIGRPLFWILLLFNLNPAKKNLAMPKKILVLELWGIGDLVMMSSALGPLRRNYPNAEIAVLVKPNASILLKYNENIDEFIEFDFPWTKFRGKYRIWQWNWRGLIRVVKKLRRKEFDLAICARGDIRNNILLFLSQSTRRVGYDFTGGAYFLTDVVDQRSSRKHRVNDWNRLLRYLELKVKNFYPKIYISEDESKKAEKFISDQGIAQNNLIVGIHPGARIAVRRWPLEKFTKVAEHIKNKYNAKIILFIGPDGYGDNMLGNFIKAKLSLRELIALMSKLALFVCNDSGPMHIATAINISVIALYGPTDPQWFGPYGEAHRILIKEGFKCRPCYDYCKYETPLCVTEISVDEVIEEVDRKMESIGEPGLESPERIAK